ncbi:MAG: hypothetical protein EBY15_02825 [Gammaproteobacteria bacterium]|nr:hypothetical protein [Gammaproteobacteria bacterium]NDG86866.1 hypothetical protein [Gammaproteobacteria bacterium]
MRNLLKVFLAVIVFFAHVRSLQAGFPTNFSRCWEEPKDVAFVRIAVSANQSVIDGELGGMSFMVDQDYKDFPALVTRLKTQSDSLSAFLFSRFDTVTQSDLKNYTGAGKEPSNLKIQLTKAINKVLADGILYDATRFRGVNLSSETKERLALAPKGPDLVRLNRRLLNDAYAMEIARHEPWTYYEASFQSNTFYVKNLTNSLPRSTVIEPGSVAGQSYTLNWDVHVTDGGSASISERIAGGNLRGVENDRPGHVALSAKRIVSGGMTLGLPAVKAGTLVWTNESGFSGQSMSEKGGRVSFNVIDWSNQLPRTVEYTMDAFPGYRYLMNYQYVDDGLRPINVPRIFSVETFYNGKAVYHATNIIEQLRYGVVPLPAEGYNYTQYTNLAKLSLLEYSAFGIHALRDGRKFVVASASLESRTGHPRWVLLALLLVLINVPVVLFWLVNKQQTKQQTK